GGGSAGGGSAGGGSAGGGSAGGCISGATGTYAFRVHWSGSSNGSTAYPYVEVNTLPVKSPGKAGVYGYSIGYTPVYTDIYLGAGGVQLDGSSFMDLEVSTTSISSFKHASLAILGRSFNTTASGGFSWQTFGGTGSTPSNFVSNVAPYKWYVADVTTEMLANKASMLVRLKSVNTSLVINRVELCLDAQ
ncbi:MAG: hypothetical protein K1X89_28115, partial [Myxococcaceae bacterium]|nr:hypothetical protein [Myxococcaceae bacterium]